MPTIENSGKQKVKVAVGERSKKPLYHRCLTTGGFMQLQPLFYRDVIPFESIDGNYEIWSRLNPMVSPCFGITNYHFSKFFVRYKDVWKGWDDFYNRALHVQSAASGDARTWLLYSPYIYMASLYNMFLENSWISVCTVNDPWDICYNPSNNVGIYYKFTDYGAHVNKVFESFGYELSWFETDNRRINILPFLCLGKIFIDHYWPKQYHNNTAFCYIRQMFQTDIANVQAVMNPSKNFLYLGLESVLKNCLTVFYDNNGFYQAWDRPEGPSDTAQISPSYNDGMYSPESSGANVISASDSKTTLHRSNSDFYAGALTHFGLQALNRLSNLLKRYQLGGSTWIDHFLANFGYVPQDKHLSLDLGTESIDVRIGDVESNSNSEITLSQDSFVSVLGSLAGKGVAAHGSKISYQNGSDCGMYIGLLSIIPDGDLYQGNDMLMYSTTPDDFYQPNDDSLGVEAVPQNALLVERIGANNNSASDIDTPFGFLPRGFRFCMSRSILSGAFRNASQGAQALSAYHLYRDLKQMGFASNTIVHGMDFMSGKDADQYNRIFYNTKFLEQFIIRFRCQFNSISSKRSLSDSYDWTIDDDHKEVVVDGNSVEKN